MASIIEDVLFLLSWIQPGRITRDAFRGRTARATSWRLDLALRRAPAMGRILISGPAASTATPAREALRERHLQSRRLPFRNRRFVQIRGHLSRRIHHQPTGGTLGAFTLSVRDHG